MRVRIRDEHTLATMNADRILIFDSRQFLDINCVAHCPASPKWCTPRRTIADYEIVIVNRGRLTFEVDGRPLFLREGEAGLFLPRRVHSAAAGQEGDMVCFHFNAPRIPPTVSPERARKRLAMARQSAACDATTHILPQMRLHEIVLKEHMTLGPWRKDIMALMHMAVRDYDHPSCNSYQRLSRCLGEVLLLLTRQTVALLDRQTDHQESGNWVLVQQALFRIRESYMRPLTVQSLAAQLKTTPQTLIRQFRCCLGRTPLQAIQETRLERANELMRDPALTLKEIAHAIGLRDPTEFSRWFRRQEGCAPRTHRQRQR